MALKILEKRCCGGDGFCAGRKIINKFKNIAQHIFLQNNKPFCANRTYFIS
jgi:hypothetical protein